MVLILGASGFIGARVAQAATTAGWTVRAGTRSVAEARRRAPSFDWVAADFAELTAVDAWGPLLAGVDAVINCVGVLQDAAGDSSRIAHIDGPAAMVAACEAAGVRRLVHLSAIGADEAAGTAYARDKRRTESLIEASGLDWIVVRPSLVIAREVYGGTALVRGLAGLPGIIPLVGADQSFRPIAIENAATAIVEMLESAQAGRRTVELAGPQSLTLAELVIAYRAWLGFGSARLWRIPRWLAWPALACGDVAAWLGWRSSLRTTSLRQLEYDAAGTAPAAANARPFSAVLAQEPAGVQDRWHARLVLLRPLAVVVLGLFWVLSGLIALGPGREAAITLLQRGGFGAASGPMEAITAALDVMLGLALWARPLTQVAAIAMAATSLAYLAVASLRLGALWLDPAGPWLKVLPMMVLCLVVAATDDRR